MTESDQEFLETGYEPSTPESDNLLRSFLGNWTATIETLAGAMSGETHRTDHFSISDTGKPGGYVNTATLLRPLPADPGQVISEIDRIFSRRDRPGIGEALIFSPWPTPDLRPFGWKLGGHTPIHLLPAGIEPPAPPSSLRITSVTTSEDLGRAESIVIEGYPFPDCAGGEPGQLLPPSILSDHRFHISLGWEEDRPVALSISRVSHGITHVFLIVTLPEARRRGYGAAMTWRAVTADRSLPAMLLSSDSGRPVYDRMGFLPLFRLTVWYRERG